MGRVVKAPEERRRELIEIALRQFIENGYEKTSVRSILKEADGEIGMFYHYFKSKNEIYEAALNFFNEQFLEKVQMIVEKKSQDLYAKVDQIMETVSQSLKQYREIQSEEFDYYVVAAIHTRTLNDLVPIFEQLIFLESKIKMKQLEEIDKRMITRFLVFGISAILHAPESSDLTYKKEEIRYCLDMCFKELSEK